MNFLLNFYSFVKVVGLEADEAARAGSVAVTLFFIASRYDPDHLYICIIRFLPFLLFFLFLASIENIYRHFNKEIAFFDRGPNVPLLAFLFCNYTCR